MSGGFSEIIKIYIEDLKLPREIKQQLIDSNPKTLADVSLWLENHKEVKSEETPQLSYNPFGTGGAVEPSKNVQLFSNNTNITSNSNFVFNKGGLVDTDDASWGLSIDRSQSTSQAAAVTYYSTAPSQNIRTTNEPAPAEQTQEQKLKEAQDAAITTISDSIEGAFQSVKAQTKSQGVISKAYNSLKEYFNSEMSESSVCRVLYAEKALKDLLKRAQNGDLTVKEYFDAKIDTAITLLTGGRELSEEDRNILKQRLINTPPEELNKIIDRIKACDNTEYAQLNDKVNTFIEEQKSKGYKNNLPDSPNISFGSISSTFELTEGERILTFEEVWEMERGVKFDPEAIKEYEETAAQYSLVAMVNNKADSVHKALDDALVRVKALNDTHYSSVQGPNMPVMALEGQFVSVLKSLYGDNEEVINAKIQEYSNNVLSYKDGKIVYSDSAVSTKKGRILAGTVEGFLQEIDKNVKNIQGEQSLKDYEEKMVSAYELAYGRKNATQLAQAFVNDQEEAVSAVRTGVEIVGTGVMVAGMFFCPPAALAGALTASFGGIGVEALNETTRKNGISEEKKNELINEIIQNAALFAVGGGASKMGNAARMALIAKKCPTFMQVAADIGVDSTISLLGDLAITGQISIEGEGLSQLLSLLAGHFKKFKNHKHKTTGSNDVSNNQYTNNIPKQRFQETNLNTKELTQKLRCKEEDAKIIVDIINSRPEIKDKLLKIVNSGRTAFEIKELLTIATPENIDDLTLLIKNKSLVCDFDQNGNIATNQFADVLNIANTYPQYKAKLIDIAANTNRPLSDIKKTSQYIQKYPQYANDILELVKSNRNFKTGTDVNGNSSTQIDEFISILEQYPEFKNEITLYANTQRKADNDVSNPITGVQEFAALLKANPDKKELYAALAKNPNLDASSINLLTAGKRDEQFLKDLVVLSSKNYSENGINYNIRLMEKYPELRQILLSEPPKYDFIDKNVTNTPQNVLDKRINIKNTIQKIAPDEIKKLRQTLGDNFFSKIKWEDIIPENANPEQIKSILADLNSSSKFFSRITSNEESYGKNIQWAHEMDIISRSAEYLISKGESYETVMNHIATMYKNYDISKTLDSNINVDARRKHSGRERQYLPDSQFARETGFSYITSFDKESNYKEYYNRFMKLLNKKRTSPYPDVELTQISLVNGYGYCMGHPRNSSVEATMKHVKQRYEEMAPLFEKVKRGEALTSQEKSLAHDKIAEIYFLMANAMPYERGSNGIADIFMRSIYKELGIEMPALKHGVSLDLEAFCLDLNEYKKKWRSFFEK